MFYSNLHFKQGDKEMKVALAAEGAGGVLNVQWGEGEQHWRSMLEEAFEEMGLWQEYEGAARAFAEEHQIDLQIERRGQLALDSIG